MRRSFPGGRHWQAVTALPARLSLRAKLIIVVLVLAGVALALSGAAAGAVLKSYLLGQADQRLQAMSSPNSGQQPDFGFGRKITGTGNANGAAAESWVLEALIGRRHLSLVHGTSLQPGQPGPAVTPGAPWLTTHAGEFVTVRAQSGNDRWRVVAYRNQSFTNETTGDQFNGTLIVGLDVTDIYRTIRQLQSADLIISALVLLVIALLGTAVVRASLRPLAEIEQTAAAIAAGDLARRVPESDPRTEVGRLGRALNAMLAQIESAFRARTTSEESARRSEEAARRSASHARISADEARRSEERMRQFVADASHELRTPLTAIRGFAEYYRQRGGVSGPPEQALANGSAQPAGTGQADGPMTREDLDRIIRRVEQEAARMGVLVDDMLLLARLDQQRPLEFRTVDMLAIAADARHDARLIAPKRAISLTMGTPAAPLVLGDEVRLRQVLGNLMSNAMTHTPDGTPIDITIRSGSLGDGHDQQAEHAEPAVIVEVTDHGPGLTQEQVQHVFERFYRTDRARARSSGGTGLGLAIVAALVDAHHGRVWADSEPGQGATFGFALPLAPEARLAAAEAPGPDSSQAGE
jgi:two-component system, OmpR family, sensor kinase